MKDILWRCAYIHWNFLVGVLSLLILEIRLKLIYFFLGEHRTLAKIYYWYFVPLLRNQFRTYTWIYMTEKLFGYVLESERSNVMQIWQSLPVIDYVYLLTNDILLESSVRLHFNIAWHWHSLCAAFSSNVGEWACSLSPFYLWKYLQEIQAAPGPYCLAQVQGYLKCTYRRRQECKFHDPPLPSTPRVFNFWDNKCLTLSLLFLSLDDIQSCPGRRTPAPGVTKFTSLVDLYLVINIFN